MSCSLQDVTGLMKRGIPAVYICTEPFVRASRAHASMLGWPDFEPVVVPQLNTLGPQAVEDLAQSISDTVAARFIRQGWKTDG